jgi:hypothetical protein
MSDPETVTPQPIQLDQPGQQRVDNTTRHEHDALTDAIVQIVSAAPGVFRLEPTLSTTLRRFGRDRVDGLQLSSHSGVVNVDISLSTNASYQARTTVMDLQRHIHELIAAHDLVSGTIAISVLGIAQAS